MSDADLFNWNAPAPYPAKGKTFDQSIDGPRLQAACQRVFEFMKDGKKRTLAQLSKGSRVAPATASARWRDLRRFGFQVFDEPDKNRVWWYWMALGENGAPVRK